MKLLEVSAAPPRSVFYQPFLKHLEKYPQNALSITFYTDRFITQGHGEVNGRSTYNVMFFRVKQHWLVVCGASVAKYLVEHLLVYTFHPTLNAFCVVFSAGGDRE